MALEASGVNFQVRMRFTDGRGNYSKYYTTSRITIEGCETEISEFPLQDISGGFIGCLNGSAEFIESEEENYVRLTPNELDSNGQVSYAGIIPSTVSFEFDFRHISGGLGNADSVYLYFYCSEIPLDENARGAGDGGEEEDVPLISNGYVIGFSEYLNNISLRYAGESIANASYEFENNTWYRAKIVYDLGTIVVYVNDVPLINVEDSDRLVEILEEHNKFGVGGRTGGQAAEHHVKEFQVTETENIDGMGYDLTTSAIGITSGNISTRNTLFSIPLEAEGTDESIQQLSSSDYLNYYSAAIAYVTNRVYFLGYYDYYDYTNDISSPGVKLISINQSSPTDTIEYSLSGEFAAAFSSLGEIRAMTYDPNNDLLIVSFIDNTSQGMLAKITRLGEVVGLNSSVSDNIFGLAVQGATLYCGIPYGNQIIIKQYDKDSLLLGVEPDINVSFPDVEDLNIYAILNQFPNFNGLSITSVGEESFFLTCIKVDLLNGGEGAEGDVIAKINMTNGEVVSAQRISDKFLDLIAVVNYGGMIGYSSYVDNNVLKPETLYWVGTPDGTPQPPVEILEMTRDEEDESSAICWNKNDGFIYRFAIRDYGNTGEED